MGNHNSRTASHSPHTKRKSLQPHRDNSASPVMRSELRIRSESLAHPQQRVRKLSSFRREDEEEPPIVSVNKNRSKSFRSANQPQNARCYAGGRRKSDICETTGLSKHQKVILVTRWKQLTQQMILDAGQRVFETIFQRDPYLLSIIHLEHLQGTDGWLNHANFNLHAQRFSHTLTQCMQNIMEPYIAADLLQEFGAAYAEEEDSEVELRDNIPHSYWDRLSSAITSTVKELLDSLTPKDGRNTLSVNDALLVNKDRLALQSNSTDICAWNVFAMFVSNQIRFGYEMERMLRAELRKLGLRNQRKTA